MKDKMKQQLQWLDDVFNMGEVSEIDLNKALFNIDNHLHKTKIKINDLELEKLERKLKGQ